MYVSGQRPGSNFRFGSKPAAPYADSQFPVVAVDELSRDTSLPRALGRHLLPLLSTFAAYGFSVFFPKTSLATVTAVTALGQPA